MDQASPRLRRRGPVDRFAGDRHRTESLASDRTRQSELRRARRSRLLVCFCCSRSLSSNWDLYDTGSISGLRAFSRGVRRRHRSPRGRRNAREASGKSFNRSEGWTSVAGARLEEREAVWAVKADWEVLALPIGGTIHRLSFAPGLVGSIVCE